MEINSHHESKARIYLYEDSVCTDIIQDSMTLKTISIGEIYSEEEKNGESENVSSVTIEKVKNGAWTYTIIRKNWNCEKENAFSSRSSGSFYNFKDNHILETINFVDYGHQLHQHDFLNV